MSASYSFVPPGRALRGSRIRPVAAVTAAGVLVVFAEGEALSNAALVLLLVAVLYGFTVWGGAREARFHKGPRPGQPLSVQRERAAIAQIAASPPRTWYPNGTLVAAADLAQATAILATPIDAVYAIRAVTPLGTLVGTPHPAIQILVPPEVEDPAKILRQAAARHALDRRVATGT
ncbi:hypothetical protein EDD29_8471 [Actinocorallia herbida]|uniref:Uncharacterized protein n=1 Tax=Actinocorallia herbida TaxID=58109 RepID=A0A3N1DB25_9ACTN|nr:hypothetical protein [Actinocorallia herbida]ROO90733.1 hypothetical protein EDD29_8471 [Actinocorallia herbida]